MLAFLQKLGRSLMVPIAVLPAAALLLRLAAPDVFDIPFIQSAGSGIFDALPLLFAIGIAIGFSKDQRGEAVLAAVVGYVVLLRAMSIFLTTVLGVVEDNNMVTRLSSNVLLGLVAGLIAAGAYNRFSNVQLPQALGFFSGRRLVPILVSVFVLVAAAVLGLVYPFLWNGLTSINNTILGLGAVGAGLHGLLNRLLLPFGLHHVLNTFLWFNVGEYAPPGGEVVTGDIPRFLAGDPSAGTFQVGFYPIMMGGLIGAVLAMIATAKPSNRRRVAGILGSAAAVSFVTGITEPLEYTFMFVAPVLYGIHALLTGVSAWLTNALGLRHGFGFSAGLIDYVLNFGLASGPITLAGLMLAFGAVYFGVFYSAIRVFNLKTPGREDEIAETPATAIGAVDAGRAGAVPATNGRSGASAMPVGMDKHGQQAAAILAAIGGAANVVAVDNCATRLRLTVHDSGQVNESQVKATGAMGVVKPSKTAVQVIVGVQSQFVADRMKEQLASTGAAVATEPVVHAPAAPLSPSGPIIPGDVLTARTQQFVHALGGPANINDVQVAANTRLRVVVRDATKIDTVALRAAGALGVMPLRDAVHVLVGAGADQYAADMQGRLLERAVG